eukprot:scaffold41896_cov69-Phaeocystis_antarctica.AAC.6
MLALESSWLPMLPMLSLNSARFGCNWPRKLQGASIDTAQRLAHELGHRRLLAPVLNEVTHRRTLAAVARAQAPQQRASGAFELRHHVVHGERAHGLRYGRLRELGEEGLESLDY